MKGEIMKTEILRTLKNEEYGIEVYIAEISNGISVAMKDTDADEFVGIARIYHDYDFEKALKYAKSLVS